MTRRPGVAFGVLAAAGLAVVATQGVAQQAIGEITATIDGEALVWRTLGPDGSGTDYNTGIESFGPMQSVSVMGFPPGRPTMRGVVQLSFTLMPGGLETLDQEVIHAPEGMSRMWVSLEGEDLITVEHFEATPEGAEVAGRFDGRVCLKEGLMAPPDPQTCRTIEGAFSTALPPR